jgi:DNA-binding MarR family transcriptional regulator
MSDDYADQLARTKVANFGHLLFRCARLFNETAVGRIQALGQTQVRTSHTALLPHIDLEGTRMVDLARRVGISKQAVGQLVQDLEQMGLLCRERDKKDKRAWRVSFTEQGKVAMLHGLGVLRGLETEMRTAVGGDRVDRLVDDLWAVQEWLEARSDLAGGLPAGLSSRTGSPLT